MTSLPYLAQETRRDHLENTHTIPEPVVSTALPEKRPNIRQQLDWTPRVGNKDDFPT